MESRQAAVTFALLGKARVTAAFFARLQMELDHEVPETALSDSVEQKFREVVEVHIAETGNEEVGRAYRKQRRRIIRSLAWAFWRQYETQAGESATLDDWLKFLTALLVVIGQLLIFL